MNNPTMSPDQMKMLAEIFRIIVKEIKTDKDVETLAPGELGIDYSHGTLLVKDPYTGKITSPNTLKYAEEIVSRYNPDTDKFNADLLNGVRLYHDLSELCKAAEQPTPDLVISRMETPSILTCKIDSSMQDYTVYGYPAKFGVLYIVKLANGYSVINFRDVVSNSDYVGRYDFNVNQFKGWNNYGLDMSRAANVVIDRKDVNTNHAHAVFTRELTKFSMFNITFTAAMTGSLMLTVNNMAEMSVMDKNLLPYQFDVAPGASILLMYNSTDKCYMALNQNNETPLQLILDIIIAGTAGKEIVTSINGESGAVILNAAKLNLTEASLFDPNKSVELAINDLYKIKAPVVHVHSVTDITGFEGFKIITNAQGIPELWEI